MMNTPEYKNLADQLKLLAHPERLRILDALRRAPECVCHLEVVIGKPQPYISQQLRLLRKAGVIQDEKEGLNVFYRLTDPQIAVWLEQILGTVETTGHQPAPGCDCPKCAPASKTAEISLSIE